MVKENELIISSGRRHLWEYIIAAIFFSFPFCLICWGILTGSGYLFTSLYIAITLGSYSVIMGMMFSALKTVVINTAKSKLITRYHIGPFSFDDVSKMPKLEYVAVFHRGEENFEVNLWYKGNKHYNMFCFGEKDPAIEFGSDVAAKLNINLLDATESGNFKWIDKISTNE